MGAHFRPSNFSGNPPIGVQPFVDFRKRFVYFRSHNAGLILAHLFEVLKGSIRHSFVQPVRYQMFKAMNYKRSRYFRLALFQTSKGFERPVVPMSADWIIRLPRGNRSRNQPTLALADVDVAAQPGPLSILPDGSINAVVSTNHLEDDFKNFFLFSSSEIAVSDHKTLQLLTIQPSGSFATQPIQAFDFDKSNCTVSCNDPSAFYFPAEVVPDGEGGLLATWTGNDSELGLTSKGAALVRHFDGSSGTLDYVVPFAFSSWFRIGLGAANVPQQLVVAENGVAFGSDGQSIIGLYRCCQQRCSPLTLFQNSRRKSSEK
jgi:hypothetical protein